jgi:hypothetical protein
MGTIDEVVIRREEESSGRFACDVRHDVPAVVFSTGGYTGNVYHEFNDGLIPLFLTTAAYKGDVVLLVLEYHTWWMSKYAEIVGQMSRYDVIDMAADGRVHCFPEVTVGLRIDGELAINGDANANTNANAKAKAKANAKANAVARANAKGNANVTMRDFQAMLHAAYLPRLQARAAAAAAGNRPMPDDRSVDEADDRAPLPRSQRRRRPKLVILSRESPRAILNEDQVVGLAQTLGFEVVILSPKPTTEMAELYAELQECDVMMGVHGAAMTHLLFLRPGATFVQVVPPGTDWAAETYYGRPAAALGLHYVAYKASALESSLSSVYPLHHPVLADPDAVNARGWSETKRIYLQGQDLTLSLPRLRSTLTLIRARILLAAPSSSS